MHAPRMQRTEGDATLRFANVRLLTAAARSDVSLYLATLIALNTWGLLGSKFQTDLLPAADTNGPRVERAPSHLGASGITPSFTRASATDMNRPPMRTPPFPSRSTRSSQRFPIRNSCF